jgi:hypothetical protein
MSGTSCSVASAMRIMHASSGRTFEYKSNCQNHLRQRVVHPFRSGTCPAGSTRSAQVPTLNGKQLPMLNSDLSGDSFQGQKECLSYSSAVLGQSSRSMRESARSASSLPPVWHVGQ